MLGIFANCLAILMVKLEVLHDSDREDFIVKSSHAKTASLGVNVLLSLIENSLPVTILNQCCTDPSRMQKSNQSMRVRAMLVPGRFRICVTITASTAGFTITLFLA